MEQFLNNQLWLHCTSYFLYTIPTIYISCTNEHLGHDQSKISPNLIFLIADYMNCFTANSILNKSYIAVQFF